MQTKIPKAFYSPQIASQPKASLHGLDIALLPNKRHDRVVGTAQSICGCYLCSIQDLCMRRCIRTAKRISKDPSLMNCFSCYHLVLSLRPSNSKAYPCHSFLLQHFTFFPHTHFLPLFLSQHSRNILDLLFLFEEQK